MGYAACIAENLCKTFFPAFRMEAGEFYFRDLKGRKLPLGIYCRCSG
jgi:hypothetical protein